MDGTYGGKYTSAHALAERIECLWPQATQEKRFVVLTGGEPLLQVDSHLVDELHRRGFRVAVETNGTIEPPANIDWVCVSPKSGAPLVVSRGNELKVVWPQMEFALTDLERLDFDNYFLQPMDNSSRNENIKTCVSACLANPKWRLSIQVHKMIGIR